MMFSQDRYRDSRNKNSVNEGNAFVDYVITRLTRSGHQCEKIIDTYRQIHSGDMILDGAYAEVKRDNRCTDTHRLSIEIAEKTNRDRQWVPSGIYANEAYWYIIGNPMVFFQFKCCDLVAYHTKHQPPIKMTNPDTVQTFFLGFDPSTYTVKEVQYQLWTCIPDGWYTLQEIERGDIEAFLIRHLPTYRA